jgi:hypothetical protein
MLTVDMQGGSRIYGKSGDADFKFHSDNLGNIALPLDHIRTLEVSPKGDGVTLSTANGDELKVQFAMKDIQVATAFGDFALPVELIRQVSVSSSEHPELARAGLVGFWTGASTDVILLGGVTLVPTAFGQAFSFDGVNGTVKIPPAPNQNVGSQVTMEFWMKADPGNAMENYQGLVASDYYFTEISTGPNGSYRMGVNFEVGGPTNGQNNFYNGSRNRNFGEPPITSTADTNGGGAQVSSGEWHHIASTYDGAKVQLYVDGKPWGNPAPHSGPLAPMAPASFISIGSDDGMTSRQGSVNGRYFKGLIDNVAIYNRVLSDDEIQADYSAGAKNSN